MAPPLRLLAIALVSATVTVPASSATQSIRLTPAGPASSRVETLTSVGGIPPHIVGTFEQPTSFQQIANGRYFVFDRRGHSVHAISEDGTGSFTLVEIGQEPGRVIEPTAFDAEPERGTFVVADAPRSQERIQIFNMSGQRLGGFTLPGRADARITLGSLVLNGVGSLQYTGQSILISQPETGSLVTEYGLGGTPVRTFGALRPTGHEDDRPLHLALNSGLPLVNPRGGFYFVFIVGAPMFRKYDAKGQIAFERHIEGREIDAVVTNLPATWPARTGGGGELPLVTPTVQAAAVDARGRLWVSLAVGCTYVYDADGDRMRIVRFRGAGLVSPTSLSFSPKGRLLVTPGLYEFDPK